MAKKRTIVEEQKIIFKGNFWQTPDGCKFNTRLKAQNHLKTLKNDI
jgi:hypothetical protein